MRVTVPWHMLPGELVESPSLDVSVSCLDMVLGSWLQVALLEQGVGPDNLQRSPAHPLLLIHVAY